MSLTGIVIALVSAALSAVALYYRYLRNEASERDRSLGRLQEGAKQQSVDRESLSSAKEIQDAVESLGSAELRDELGRFVRKP